MSKGLKTKARIVDVAADIMQSNGYHAMGINQITAQGDLPKGSIYFHFPGGKEEIALAAIEKGGDAVHEILVAAGQTAGSSTEYMERVTGAFAQLLTSSDFQKGCPVSSISLEMAPNSSAITEAVASVFERWHRDIEDALIALQCPHPDLKNLSSLLLSSVEGALILCRVRQSTQPLADLCKTLHPLLTK